MPKLKTKSAAKKRFRITGKGRIKRKQAFHSHKATSKTKKRKRNLRKSALVSKSDEKNLKKILPHK